MDLSSEMSHSVLPLLVVGTFGASVAVLGIIEGVAESTAAFTKLFSGALSDRFGRRKPLALLGYGASTLVKPLFPLADGIAAVATARFLDRVGKGIRGAPRDALVADLTPPERHGAAFGLRQSLDSVGAVLGPLVAFALMAVWAADVRLVLWIAVVPAVVCLVTLVVFVRERGPAVPAHAAPRTFADFHWRRFPARFWWFVALVALFTLMRISEGFLVLRTQDAGLSPATAPLALVVMNVAYVLCAYPAGRLSDRMPRARLLVIGCLVMAFADALLAISAGPVVLFAGIALWGVHMGLTEGIVAALTADHAPAALRATAFGVVNVVRAAMLFVASALAGALWAGYGAATTFAVAGLVALATAVAIGLLERR
jgi:MFS family permease